MTHMYLLKSPNQNVLTTNLTRKRFGDKEALIERRYTERNRIDLREKFESPFPYSRV